MGCLLQVLDRTVHEFKQYIQRESVQACCFDLGDLYEKANILDDVEIYRGKKVMAPVKGKFKKKAEDVLLRGDLLRYVRLESGIIIPHTVAEMEGVAYHTYDAPTHLLLYPF